MPAPARRLAFDLVMFDLDGTLVATAGELADAVNDTFGRIGLPPVDEARVERWIGHGTRELLVQALAEASGEDAGTVRASRRLAAALGKFDACYESRCGSRSRLYPQVEATLRHLHADGVTLAVVTNKDGVFTRRLLDSHGLTPLFGLVVSGDAVPLKKPAPDGIAMCLARFGVEPARALFVGDSSIDVATARNAGVAVWALPGGYNMGRPIADSRPDRVIDDVSALLQP